MARGSRLKTAAKIVQASRPVKEGLIVRDVWGNFLMDPNEYNGWGDYGIIDVALTQKLGSIGDANLSQYCGGFSFPFDVRLVEMFIKHRDTNSAAGQWGWAVASTTPANDSSSSLPANWVLDEVQEENDAPVGQGPRDYNSTKQFITDLSFDESSPVIPARDTITLMVGCGIGNPTTNYYVRVQSGYMAFERV